MEYTCKTGMIDTSEMFEDSASGRMKGVIFRKVEQTRLIYLAVDKCLESRAKIDGDILVRVLTMVFNDDFFPFDAGAVGTRYEFMLSHLAQLLAAGLFRREGKHGKTLSFGRNENETVELRRETKEAVEKYLNPGAVDEWLKHVDRIYSEGEEVHAMHDKKESTLN